MHDGNEQGPYSDSQIQLEIARGNLKGDDQGWREGMAAWQPLYQFVAGVKEPSSTSVPIAPVSLSEKLEKLKDDSAYPGLRRALDVTKAFALILLIIGIIAVFFGDYRGAGLPMILTSISGLFWSYLVEVLIDIADAVIARSS